MNINEEINSNNNDNNDMIDFRHYLDEKWFFTLKSKETCKKQKIKYIKPLDVVLSKSNNNDIVLSRQTENGYYQFCSMKKDKLDLNWKHNHHFYEILREKRKPYFDIEYTANSSAEYNTILMNIRNVIKKSLINLGVEIKTTDFTISYSKGIGESGLFKNKTKYSIHIVINNGYYFKSQKDIYLYRKYLEELILTDDEYKKGCIDIDGNCAVDFSVYKKNNSFKLPYQSKLNSDRIQRPIDDEGEYCECDLSSFLVSDIPNEDENKIIDVSSIKLKEQAKLLKVKEEKGLHITNWSSPVVVKWTDYMELKHKDYEIRPNQKVSTTIDYLIHSIPNFNDMPYDIYFCLGSALKRCVKDENEAFRLWNEWSKTSKDINNENQLHTNYNYDDNINIFKKCSNDKTGYNTLLCLACYCNPLLRDFVKIEPYKFIFDDGELKNILRHEINVRYNENAIKIVDVMNKYDFVFIKAPMGCGKSYSLHLLFNLEEKYKRVVYLSSRRAFACSMSSDFEVDGFVNYFQDPDFNGKNDRVIISIESIKKLRNIDNIDLLIIDESESIFNILSSSTLWTNDALENLDTFYEVIKNSKKIMIMDAYLSNRSVIPITNIRNITKKNTTYIVNNFKYDEREVVIFNRKQELILQIITELQQGKNCCLVSGSRKYGIQVLNALKDKKIDVKHKFYNKNNPFESKTDVNKEWSDIQLLIYSPSITCGISYTNPEHKYDNLFIYCVNKGSTHMRDIFQAHKRIRDFTSKRIYMCINDAFDGFNQIQQPLRIEELKEYYTSDRKTLFKDETHYEEITNIEKLKDWVFDIHLFNILEMNVNQKYLRKVADKYLEIENIKKINVISKYSLDDIDSIHKVPNENWKWKKIKAISDWEYSCIKRSMNEEKHSGLKILTDDDRTSHSKFIYEQRLKDDVCETDKEKYFDEWFVEPLRPMFRNIKVLKKMIFMGENKWKETNEQTNILETYDKKLLAYFHIYHILTKLNVIENKKINLDKTFTTLDLKEMVEEYKKPTNVAINQLFTNSYYHDKDKKGKVKEITSRTIHTYLNKLLKDWICYNIEKVSSYKKNIKVEGKDKKVCKTITKYKLAPFEYKDGGNPIQIENNIFEILNDEWLNIDDILDKRFKKNKYLNSDEYKNKDVELYENGIKLEYHATFGWIVKNEEKRNHYENCECMYCDLGWVKK